MKRVHLGDEGFTYIMYGERVAKEDPLIDLIGDVDELNSFIGLARSLSKRHRELDELLKKIQDLLFRVGRDLAFPRERLTEPTVSEEDLREIDRHIEDIWGRLGGTGHVFVYPTGSLLASVIHIARTVCRRAERKASRLYHEGRIQKIYLVVLNRLSDLLYVLARYSNMLEGVEEEEWRLGRSSKQTES